MIKHNAITGHPNQVFETLNRKIGQYKARYTHLKIGITGRSPEIRFREHRNNFDWNLMLIIYETSSNNYANTLESWLVAHHRESIVNIRIGGGSNLSFDGSNYVYLLLK